MTHTYFNTTKRKGTHLSYEERVQIEHLETSAFQIVQSRVN